jgi:hypothetical protein
MTVNEFLEEYNYAPCDNVELAEIASEVEGEVGLRAREFLSSLDMFEKVLDSIGYERG